MTTKRADVRSDDQVQPRADVVLSLDADFFTGMPGSDRYARDFMSRRRTTERDAEPSGTPRSMTRLYAVESTPGLVGAVSDHRLPLRAADVENLARRVAADLGAKVADWHAVANVPADWLKAVVSDLKASRGRSLVIAGEGQPAIVHALVHAINRALNNVSQTVEYVESVEARPTDQLASLRELTDQGDIKLLVVLGGNPVYNAPGELEFVKHFDHVKPRVHLSEHLDERSFLSHRQSRWHSATARQRHSKLHSNDYDCR